MAEQWPVVTTASQPLPDAELWAARGEKRSFLKL
ncbi:DUF3470 domain-containing protein [Cupriavidus necator]